MHAVSDSAASSNENSLYALGPRMAAHYTRGSACEHMALRADDVSLLCAWTNAQSHTPVRCALFCPETPPAPLERRSRPQKGPRFYGLEQLQRVRSGDSESCAAYDPAGLPSARLYPGCIHARTPERLLITLLRCTSESHRTSMLPWRPSRPPMSPGRGRSPSSAIRSRRSSTVGRIAVARSVDNDDDARWLAQRLHRSFGSSVDVNPRSLEPTTQNQARSALRSRGQTSCS
jgi:hypothetical protein